MSDEAMRDVAAERGKGLPQFLLAAWDSFGDPSLVAAMPTIGEIPSIPHGELGDSLSVRGYELMYKTATAALASFVEIDKKVAELVANSNLQSDVGQKGVNSVIDYLNEQAPKRPGPEGETEHIMNYVTRGLKDGEEVLRGVLVANKKIADGIADNANQLANGADRLTKQPPPNTTTVGLTKPPPRRLDPDTGRQRAAPNSGDPAVREQLARLEKKIADAEVRNRQLAQTGPPAPQNGQALGGGDPLSQMLALSRLTGGLTGGFNGGLNGGNDPRLLGQQDELRAERDRLRRERERMRDAELERRDRNVAPPPPPPPPRPPVAAAASPPPPRLAPDVPLNAQPAKEDSEAKGAAPARTPDEDGKVLYTFEDGRQQRVWPVVADALDVALADNSGTNAQAAYGDTSAKWNDDKEIGARVDPNQLQTGDVSAFENTEAIAVVWGSPDSGGTLELVVNGKLVPFDPESKEFEALGPFVGFMHPPIDPGAAGGGVDGAPASVVTENQGAPVAVG